MTTKQHPLRARQLNPSDDLFWKSRGWPARPTDWRERHARGDLLPPSGRDRLGQAQTRRGAASAFFDSLLSKGKTAKASSNNPDHLAYWQAQGWDEIPDRAEKNNPNNDAYWVLKGYEERPPDWEKRGYAA